MNIKIKKRLYKLLLFFACLAIGITIILGALKDNIVFFYTPSEIPLEMSSQNPSSFFRIGGVVKAGSIIQHTIDNITFNLTDSKNEILIYYKGGLPILFREEQGIVAYGNFEDGKFIAKEILAKHDERYIPKKLVK